MSKNKSLSDLIEEKIYSLINHQLKKIIKPAIELEKVTDLDLKLVKKLKSKYGIGGIILDVDDTIRKDMMDIPRCNKEWIKYMKQEFKILILSNGYDEKIKNFTNANGIEYMAFAKKPMRGSLMKACNKMGLDPANVLMVGDSVVSDIYGGNRCGMVTAIINSVDDGLEK